MKFMSDAQCAYIAGQDPSLPLGGVGCHAYFEFDCGDIDEAHLAEAWRRLFTMHPEMRAVYSGGIITDREELPECSRMEVVDLTALSDEEKDAELKSFRGRVSVRSCKTENGECCGLWLIRLGSDENMLAFDWSLVAGDVKSFVLVLSELAELYCGREPKTCVYSTDKLLKLRAAAASATKARAESIIAEDIAGYPYGLTLPYSAKPEELSACRYAAADRLTDCAAWITTDEDADARLMYAFTAALCSMTGDGGLLVNYPCFRRSEAEKGCVGDLTDIKLIPMAYDSDVPAREGAERAYAAYRRYMSFTGYRAANIRRRIARLCPERAAAASVVFSPVCDVPLLSGLFTENIGRLRYMISQTPQVMLDVQTFVLEGSLYISIVYPQELFSKDFAETLADNYVKYISLADEIYNNGGI